VSGTSALKYDSKAADSIPKNKQKGE